MDLRERQGATARQEVRVVHKVKFSSISMSLAVFMLAGCEGGDPTGIDFPGLSAGEDGASTLGDEWADRHGTVGYYDEGGSDRSDWNYVGGYFEKDTPQGEFVGPIENEPDRPEWDYVGGYFEKNTPQGEFVGPIENEPDRPEWDYVGGYFEKDTPQGEFVGPVENEPDRPEWDYVGGYFEKDTPQGEIGGEIGYEDTSPAAQPPVAVPSDAPPMPYGYRMSNIQGDDAWGRLGIDFDSQELVLTVGDLNMTEGITYEIFVDYNENGYSASAGKFRFSKDEQQVYRSWTMLSDLDTYPNHVRVIESDGRWPVSRGTEVLRTDILLNRYDPSRGDSHLD